LNNNEIPVLGNLNEVESDFMASTISDLWDNLPFYSNSSLSYKNTQHTYHRLIHSWFTEMQFAIRAATPEDVELYLHWANQPDVRQSALNSEPILPENHRKWFASRLTSQCTKLYVGMIHNIPVAQLRFDLHDEIWEIDYSVDPDYRNRGIGEILIRKGMKQLLEEVNTDCIVVGLVKPTNLASAEVFKKLHFTQQKNVLRSEIELLCFHYALQRQLLSL
jgi:RimJ/RimL family protein N-acetyltransferase